MVGRHARPLVAVAAAVLLAAGCGSRGPGATPPPARSGSGATGSAVPAPAPGSSPSALPTPGPTGVPADPAAVRVIRGWSSALRVGDLRAAARYFALPSEFINGPSPNGQVPVLAIRTIVQAEAVNATLPCGAVFVSADQRGRYVNALFRLTDRKGLGAGCGSGTGQEARTNFVISAGRIVQWIRAVDDPGDNPGSGSPPTPAAPSPRPGPVV